jgi:hypothetical protein
LRIAGPTAARPTRVNVNDRLLCPRPRQWGHGLKVVGWASATSDARPPSPVISVIRLWGGPTCVTSMFKAGRRRHVPLDAGEVGTNVHSLTKQA